MNKPKLQITHCFAEIDGDTMIDAVNPNTGRGLYSGETLEDVRKRYPKAQLMTVTDHLQAKGDRQHTPITLENSTEEKYWEMLEVLPPAVMMSGSFLVGEPVEHSARDGAPMFEAYFLDGGKYFHGSRCMTVAEFRFIVSLKYAGAAA